MVQALTADSFPTEQVQRAKDRKAASGLPANKPKRRAQTAQQVFDDCGKDDTPLRMEAQYS